MKLHLIFSDFSDRPVNVKFFKLPSDCQHFHLEEFCQRA